MRCPTKGPDLALYAILVASIVACHLLGRDPGGGVHAERGCDCGGLPETTCEEAK
jgi:hypothetical protein